ncbi:hypothetical protein SEUCBS140593_005034 [Sporothrix eucalyptigena]|uniref:Zn(2)-C6 fungal-type domain-containing protein n=1 Tax=Sporothrix eucalyptigena TaxID=1812306 RepID=A0ABP0BUL6_9PEZI
MHSGGGGGRHRQPSLSSVPSAPSVPSFPPSSPTTPTPSSTTTTSGSQRKERGAIAAQACDTCRSRKQKCDEQRPKCGTCQKFRLDCHYREPQPTKKDKTLGEILDRLKSVESKIDLLSPGASVSAPFGAEVSSSSTAQASGLASTLADGYKYSPGAHQMLAWPVVQQLLAPVAARRPQLNVKALGTEPAAQQIVLGLHHADRLPTEAVANLHVPGMAGVPGGSVPGVSVPGVPMPVMPTMAGGPPSRRDSTSANIMAATPTAGFYPPTPVSLSLPLATFPTTSPSMSSSSLYSWDTLFRLSNAYFDSFNYIAPIVDRQTFQTVTLPAVLDEKSRQDNESAALVFLVAALGDVAVAGAQGAPVFGGTLGSVGTKGVKGGTVSHPPGLALFNEARQRMGFVIGACSLECVQIHALAGIYCSTCLRHMEYWRYTTAASLACQALITSKPAELSSPRADLIRQIFWYCLIIETHFNLELGLPLTGLDRFEDRVGLPSFSGPYSQDDYLANQASHFQEHFASQIVLRRLCVAFHAAATGTSSSSSTSLSSLPAAIRQMALQLEGWRGMLPPHLRWQEARPADFPNTGATADASTSSGIDLDIDVTTSPDEIMFGSNVHGPPSSALFTSTTASTTSSSSAGTAPSTFSASTSSAPPSSSSTSAAAPTATMFSANLDALPVAYPFALDLQVALLRSRYYYTKFLVYKPCLYKAMHATSQDDLSEEDAAGAAACLQACLSWPVALSPTAAHKRLIPCVFFYTQNFLGTLLILRLAAQLPVLQRITATLCGGPRFVHAARETTALCIAWLRDLRGIDRAAAWAWAIVQGLYHLEE